MAVNPDDARRFSEEEVALIIKRAAEMQTEHAEAAPVNAMSLTEVEEIAKEAGIDPLLVRRAAQGLDYHTDVANRPSPWVGAPTRIVFERVVDGEVGPDVYEVLVNEIRRTIGTSGAPSVLGRTMAWTTLNTGGRGGRSARNVEVSVTSRGGVTTIRAEEELRGLAGGLFGGLMAGGAGGTTGMTVAFAMSTFESAAIAAGLWVLVAGSFYALARTIFSNIARKRERELKDMVTRLAGRVEEEIDHAGREKLSAAPSPPSRSAT